MMVFVSNPTSHFRDNGRKVLSSRLSLSYIESFYAKTQDLNIKNEVLLLAGKIHATGDGPINWIKSVLASLVDPRYHRSINPSVQMTWNWGTKETKRKEEERSGP